MNVCTEELSKNVIITVHLTFADCQMEHQRTVFVSLSPYQMNLL